MSIYGLHIPTLWALALMMILLALCTEERWNSEHVPANIKPPIKPVKPALFRGENTTNNLTMNNLPLEFDLRFYYLWRVNQAVTDNRYEATDSLSKKKKQSYLPSLHDRSGLSQQSTIEGTMVFLFNETVQALYVLTRAETGSVTRTTMFFGSWGLELWLFPERIRGVRIRCLLYK